MKKAFGQTVRDIKRGVNKKVLKVPSIEQKVLDATSNEAWGPHGTHLADIAQASKNYHEYQMIMSVVWKRLNDTGKNWRHVFKALTVLEYLVANGSERVIEDIREQAYHISTLSTFQYIDSAGRDQGSNVRKKSLSLVALVNDKERIQEVREKAAASRDKFRNMPGGPGDDHYEGRYGSRDEGQNGYGGREWGDDRYGRDGGRYGEDQYGRDGYKDDEYRGRSQSADSDHGPRSQSSDRDREQGFEDDGHHSSRGSNARVEDGFQDGSVGGSHLEPKLSGINPEAPPSYEDAVGQHHGSVANNRDGETATTFASKPSSPQVNINHQETLVSSKSAAPAAATPPPPVTSNMENEGFDLFDPRGSFSVAPPPASGGAEMDLFGSLSDSFSSHTSTVVQTIATPEAHHPTNPYLTFMAEPPAAGISSQPFDDPFGDGPFRAVPSTDGFGDGPFRAAPSTDGFSAQPPTSAFTTSAEPQLPVAPTSHMGFGDAFDETVDILADILPPPGSSQTDFQALPSELSIQTGQPYPQTGFPEQPNQTTFPASFPGPFGLPTSQSTFSSQVGQSMPQNGFQPQSDQYMPPPDFPPQAGQLMPQNGFKPQNDQSTPPPAFPPQVGQSMPQNGFQLQSDQSMPPPAFPPQVGQSVTRPVFPPQGGQSVPQPGLPPQAGVSMPQPDFPVQGGQSMSKPAFPPQSGQSVPQTGLPPQVGQSMPQNGFQLQSDQSTPPPAFPPQVGQSVTRPAFPPQGGQSVPQLDLPPQGGQPMPQGGQSMPHPGLPPQAGQSMPQNGQPMPHPAFPPQSGQSMPQPGSSPQGGQSMPPATFPVQGGHQSSFQAQGGQSMLQPGFPAQGGQSILQPGFPAQGGQLMLQPGFVAQGGQSLLQPGFPNQGGQSLLQPGFAPQGGQNSSLGGFSSQLGTVSQAGFPSSNGQPGQPNNFYGGFRPQGSSATLPSLSQITLTPAPQYNTSNSYQQPLRPLQSSSSLASSQPALTASTGALAIVPQQPAKDKFETKSTVWADTLNRGLVNLNISGSKTNPLSDIGIDFEAINRKEKRMEKPSKNPVTSNVTMGKAMGSGSGIGRAGAGALRPAGNPMVGPGMGLTMGPRPGFGAGYGGVNQPMGMNMPPNMGIGMNIGQGFQMQPAPAGFPPAAAMPGNYNPMLGNGTGYGQQPYGGYR